MKKALVFFLLFVILLSCFVFSTSAAGSGTPTEYDIPTFSGPLNYYGRRYVDYETFTSDLAGTYYFPPANEAVLSDNYSWIIDEDYTNLVSSFTDHSGNSVAVYSQTFYFSGFFGVGSDVRNFSVPSLLYDSIQVLYSSTSSNSAYVYEISVFNSVDIGVRRTIYHNNTLDNPDQAVYYFAYSYLYFPVGDRYSPSSVSLLDYRDKALGWGDLLSGETNYEFIPDYASQTIVPESGTYTYPGMFLPVMFVNGGGGGSGSGGSGSGGSGSSDAPTVITSAFSSFVSILMIFFSGILNISFFGGFFSIGDLIGIIFALSIMILFVKWFAGG